MSYTDSAFNTPAALLLPGQPGYSFGSLNDHVSATKMVVTNSEESAGNVITLAVKVVEGNIPTTSQFVSTQGLINVANKSDVAIASVTIDDVTGIGTITFADAGAAGAIVSAPDSGIAVAPVAEVADTLTVGVAGQQFALGNFAGVNVNGRTIAWEITYPSAPASVTALLQASLRDVDVEYQTLDTSSNAGGELRYVQDVKFNFVRVKISATSGGTFPTVIAKVAI